MSAGTLSSLLALTAASPLSRSLSHPAEIRAESDELSWDATRQFPRVKSQDEKLGRWPRSMRGLRPRGGGQAVSEAAREDH